MSAGATHMKELVPGEISRGATTLEKSDSKTVLMTEAEAKAMTAVTAVTAISPSLTIPL